MALPRNKRFSALLRRITSKDDGDFYSLNFRHSLKTEKVNLNLIKKLCTNKYFCGVGMPSEGIKNLE